MLPADFKPCLAGAVIANQAPFQSDVVLLRQLISAPHDIYQALYLTTLYAFMEWCQAIPSDVTQPTSQSLLAQRFSLTIAALKLRRGHMLPLHSDSETIAEQEPLWTYALFTAGLLWRLFDRQQYSIELYKSVGERLGLWHPLAGNLAEPNTYYKIIAQPPAFILDTVPFQALIVGKIIPAVGLRWLAEYPSVFIVLWAVITDQAQPKNVLMSLLQKAAQETGLTIERHHSVIANDQNSTTPQNHAEQAPAFTNTTDHTLDVFNHWLITHLNDHHPSRLFLRIPQGLFVSVPALNLLIEQEPTCASLAALLDQLENSLLHNISEEEASEASDKSKAAENKDHSKNLFFRYRSVHFEQRQVLEGIVIKEKYLSPALKAIPLQKNFIPDLSF